MSDVLPSSEVLDKRIAELQNRLYQAMGVCDLIAHASDDAVCRDALNPDSIHSAALLAREAVSRVASDLADVLDRDPA